MSVHPIRELGSRADCLKMRNNTKEYFCKPEGGASWQDEHTYIHTTKTNIQIVRLAINNFV